MASVTNLPPPKPMELKGNLSENWNRWKQSWEYWKIATKLNKEEEPVIVASLHHVLGPAVSQIAEKLPGVDKSKNKSILDALTKYFEPQKNETFERYKFNTAVQGEDNIDAYLNRLRHLVSTCGFNDLTDALIRDRIVIGINDQGLRKRLLREKDLTLDKAVDICRAAEQAQIQMKLLDGEAAQGVNHVKTDTKQKGVTKTGKFHKKRYHKPQQSYIKDCQYCGTCHKKGACPAYGKKCGKCGRMNHYDKVCKSEVYSRRQKPSGKRPVHQVHEHEQSDTEDEYTYGEEAESDTSSVYQINNCRSRRSQYLVKPLIKDSKHQTQWKEVTMQIDNGSAANCIRQQDLATLATKPKLKKSNMRLTTYSGDVMHPLGQIDLDVRINGKEATLKFQVIDNASTSLLSGQASEDLGLITVNHELLVNSVTVTQPLTREQFVKEFSDVFQGLGDIGEYKIELNPEARPTQDAPRSVPVALKEELKKRLDEMTKSGMLKKETEPTEWVNSAVYVKKPGKKIRVCLDPQQLNKNIKIPKYRMPTLDDITPELSKVRVFTICDAKDGFLQIRLDETSSKYTTFHTPFGRYRWLRMPFGISSAPEEFQRRTLEILEGLNGVHAIADDCIIVGAGDTLEAAIEDHDRNFTSFLQRCREKNYKLNLDKLRFRLDSVKYHGHILTSDGLLPDPDKVAAIRQMPRPKDKAETKRLLGMVTYLSKFVPKLSDISQPLRELTKEDTKFIWSTSHEKALLSLKDLISSPPCLKYYDVDDEVTIETDSSEFGLGAVITQQGRPVAYASRTLTATERRYSQIEKECLAVVFGTHRFDQYLRGRESVTAYTDHKPLEVILNKSINTAPKRLQRMMLRLQRYHLKIIYKKGAHMYISDHLSRSPNNTQTRDRSTAYDIFNIKEEEKLFTDIEETDPEIYHNVSDKALTKVSTATAEDEVLQELISHISNGFPEDKSHLAPELKTYWPYRDELSVENGVIYRGTRVVIPATLRHQITERLHASHLGAQTTLRKARDSVYWPTIQNDIYNTCEQCATCQEHKPANTKEPMRSQPIPTRRWQVCSTDLFTLRGKEYLIVVDNLTKYWDLEQLSESTAEHVIERTKAILSRYGIPELMISDNGPSYSAKEYKDFAESWGFIHYTSSPHHSQGNGTAEAAVKVIKSILKKAEDPYLSILEHRNTPDVTGKSASQKLNSRKLRTCIPVKSELNPKVVMTEDIISQSVKKKQQNKAYYDRNSKVLPRLSVGENIRARLKPQASKLWSKGSVTAKVNDGSYIISSGGNTYRRQRRHLRTSKETVTASSTRPEMEEIIIPPQKNNPVVDQDTNHKEQSKSPVTEQKTDGNRSSPMKTRSGRTVVPPSRYREK